MGSLLYAQPSKPSVRHGEVTFQQQANQLRIQQSSSQAIVNWQSFSIPEGHAVNIAQPGSASALLNRVTGADPSRLMGQLNANGKVYLINPNGIVVGNGARINAGAFIASTLDVSDTDFLNGGDLLFSGSSTRSVVNLGSITATNGDVILVGYEVSNQGTIQAPGGVVALGAGREVLLTPEGDQRITIITTVDAEPESDEDTEEDDDEEENDAPDASKIGSENQGVIEAVQAELKAAGGNVYDLAVNQAGIIRATGVENRDGRIYLTSDQGAITHSGELSAHNLDGSGGEVFVGGDYQGANAEVANAATTYVAASAVLDVSAVSSDASGGRVIVWSDEKTTFHGTIDGRAGEQGGDGGFAEVSGKQILDYQGTADLRASAGQVGELLLDPVSLRIQAGSDVNVDSSASDPHEYEPADRTTTSILSVATLESQLALSDVKVDTATRGPRPGEIDFTAPAPATPVEYGDGTIVVDSPIAWTSGNQLHFNSGNNIEVNASIDGGSTGDIIFGLGQIEPASGNAFYTLPAVTSELQVAASATVSGNHVTLQHANSELLYGALGSVYFQGILNANILEMKYPVDAISQYGGILGAVSFANPNNAIGTLRGDVASGRLQGDFTVMDGSGGLNVENEFVADFGAEIRIATQGDLTLKSGALISTGTFQGTPSAQDSDIYLSAQGGNFINEAGAGAVNAAGTGRFLIYSNAPTGDNKGGLTGDPVYNKTYTANDPSTITQTGDRFLYGLAPTLTLTANPASKQQGDANPAFSYTVSGLVSGDDPADVFSGVPVLSSTATTGTAAGTASIDVATGTVSLSDYDYLINLVAGVLTIDPGPIQNLLITAQNAAKTFGENNPAFAATFSIPAAVNDVSGLQFSVSALLDSPVGTYVIMPFGATGTGYNISYAPGTLTVNPRLLTIGAADLTKTYGDVTPAFTPTFDNLASFHTVTDMGALVLNSPATAQFVDAGSYSITPSGAVNSNYTISYSNGTATVDQRPVTLTADGDSREYGDANPVFFATPSGFVNNDYARSNLTIGTSATATSNVGNYDIVPSAYNDSNYDVSFVNGTLEITQAPLTLTAADASRDYGDANPGFDFSGTGFKNAEDETVIQNVIYDTAAIPGSDVGNYDIDILSAVAGNYDLSFAPGTLTIDPRPILINVDDASRMYGDANPGFAPSNNNTNLVPGLESLAEVIAFDTVAGVTDYVGNYPITATLLDPNYSLTTTPGSLTVNPRPLSIFVENVGRDYGDENPEFTFQDLGLYGIVNGDDVGAMLNLQTVAPSPAKTESGFYLIERTGNVDPRKYSMPIYQSGVLTVYPRAITLTVDDAQALIDALGDSRTAGDLSGLAYTVTADNLAAGDTVARDVAPGLTFRTFNGTTTASVVSADYRDQMVAPSPFSPAFAGGFALYYSPPPTEDATFTSSDIAVSYPDEDFRQYLGILPDQGYLLANRNYVVTAIEPATVRHVDADTVRTVISPINLITLFQNQPDLEIETTDLGDLDISDITLTPTELGHLPQNEPLVIGSMSDYTSNIGVYFSGHADVTVEMVTQYLNELLSGGSGDDLKALYFAIFGETPLTDPLDEAAIRAWLADIESNVEKRSMLGIALIKYLEDLQGMDPATLSIGQQLLAEVVALKVEESRREYAEMLLERQENYENYPVATQMLARAREALKTQEKKAANAALDYLEEYGNELSDQEVSVLENILASVLDGDHSSSIAMLEQWVELRKDVDPKEAIDNKLSRFLENMGPDQEAYETALAAFEAGEDLEDFAKFKGYSVYDMNAGIDYGELLKETNLAGLEAKMARYEILANNSGLISAAASVTAGGAAFAGGYALGTSTAIGSYVFVAMKGAMISTGTVGVKALAIGTGPAVIAAAAAGVTTWAGIELVQQGEQKQIFDDLVAGGTKKLTLADLDFSPQAEVVTENVKPKDLADELFKQMMVSSLDELLLGM